MNKDAQLGFYVCSPFILLAFLSGLKIGEVIDWSWWWITAVVWVPALLLGFWIAFIAFFIWTFHGIVNKEY